MTRDAGSTGSSGAGQFDEIARDDALIDAISRGEDPTQGADPLAQVLLDFRADVVGDMPAAPTLTELGFEEPTASGGAGAEVVDITQRRRRRFGYIGSALVGAAAATLLIAGVGGAILSAGPGSPLYGLNKSIFGGGEETAVVQLASTLEEANQKSEEGDLEAARQLVAEAREIVNAMSEQQRTIYSHEVTVVERHITSTVTTTVTVTTTETPTPEPTAMSTLVPTSPEPTPQTSVPVTSVVPSVPAAPEPSATSATSEEETPSSQAKPSPVNRNVPPVVPGQEGWSSSER